MYIYLLLGFFIGLYIKSLISEIAINIVFKYLKEDPKQKKYFKDKLREALEKDD